jgi:hypothetical protein
MLDRDQLLFEAAQRYEALIEGEPLVSIPDFVASVNPELREELATYLELVLAIGDLTPPTTLRADEQALADRAVGQMQERWKARAAHPSLQTLTQMRSTLKLTLAALARQLNLPVDLLARIERGGVDAATIPERLVSRLADVLGRASADIRSALAAPQLAPAGVRLSAEPGTVRRPETAVSFAEALAASTATTAQRQEWS